MNAWAAENYLFLSNEESRTRRDFLLPFWQELVQSFTRWLHQRRERVWNREVAQAARLEMIWRLNGLLQQHHEVSVRLAAELELDGWKVADKHLTLLGHPSVSPQHVVDPLRPILDRAWKGHAFKILEGFERDMRAIQQGATMLAASGKVLEAVQDNISAQAWRATRIIRTEASHSYHSGTLSRILVNPGALQKVLVSPEYKVLETRQPLELFTFGADRGFWAPPSHPNSRNTMIAV